MVLHLGLAGTLVARMDYSPFGQLIARYNFTQPGDTTLSRLPFGFSTKYTDRETGLLYYGYRHYDPLTGRWPSRDPIGERGGINVYGFVGNDGVDKWDLLGLRDVTIVIHYYGFDPNVLNQSVKEEVERIFNDCFKKYKKNAIL
jgi:RHS repeat-associated protein